MDRKTFDQEIRRRYTENPNHLRQQAAALRRIAASLKGGRDTHGNPASTFEAAAQRHEAKAARLEA